ncbi:zinc finger protein 507 [Cyprinodon tularosa]|uniref:zinc finger protein 507 n=1 Tax=Cyprinodon tularosa TaxID=77115 RepID=UPI0018E237B8|nr:zinc finger protein 507 [Cyprinodon tularosa]
MDEISSVAVLISKSSASPAASSSPGTPASLLQTRPQDAAQPRQVDESLIQVIEKLSKIVEKRPQRHCALGGRKRGQDPDSPSGRVRQSLASSPKKKIRINVNEEEKADGGDDEDDNNNSISAATGVSKPSDHKRTVTCYQCSLCPFLSQTLPQLREHLKQHDEQHSDLILMCSECHFTSRDQDLLEAHVRLHFDDGASALSAAEGTLLKRDGGGELMNSAAEDSTELQKKKKWYSYEEYGLYRCLICSYVCSQQRMLKTHAWKHAGLVDCSYPIFEEEDSASGRQETQAPPSSTAPREDVVILQSPGLDDKSVQAAVRLQLCMPPAPVSNSRAVSATTADGDAENGYVPKDVSAEEPAVEVHVITEADCDMEVGGGREGSSAADSLLSSAQKIINSGPNSVGHINVIVERLPSAEDSVMAAKPLLLAADVDRDQRALCVNEEEEPLPAKPPLPTVDDENVPPTSRKRTHSESLRLHSLAAEALVAMPMRTLELPAPSPTTGVKMQGVPPSGQRASDLEQTTALLDLKLCRHGKEEEFRPLRLVDGDEESPATKAGISLSLLTVIERLRERSDQNASDEDILKELQDNAQIQNGALAGAAAPGNGVEDGLAGSPDGGLVDYNPGSERPYRCRLCHYSSSNKGYIKQHLRVHRQRAPYQCPICEHKASDSKDLEDHMIYHCKTRMHQCRHCPQTFHYKSQLRSHEREHLSCSSDTAPLTDTIPPVEESERGTDEDGGKPKFYRCDVCSYTSATYIGVRNHRRIHNSDKPYRCCSCDFATTNMNSLKSHMRRHPQEHQAVQLLEQYRCSLCGYVCSHPPSLKSHMWKHAGDQNYNYEQVNRAINEAISQSSRTSQRLSGLLEAGSECAAVAPDSKEKAETQVDPLPAQASAAKASPPAGNPAGLPTDSSPCPTEGKDTTPSHVRTEQLPTMEYCVLLFCCCICGFESTSKERLMEHMKEHEGDIISIILNKEQHQQEAEAQASL